ncbi:MAG: hypothetical protein KDC90_13295, partial [Ignavibacteriae bacterium]|nr:hypothetical protein [Ignavibacteriota bacterium]
DEDKSLNLLKKSLLIAPENVQVIFRAATIYEKLGNRDQSLHWIEDAIKKGYSQSDIENQPELKELIADARYKVLVKQDND